MQARPKKVFDKWVETKKGKQKTYKDSVNINLSDDEIKFLKKVQGGAGKDVALALLVKLAIHKRMENDQDRQKMLFMDYVSLLCDEPEYILLNAILYLIEYDEENIFPTLGKIKRIINGFTPKDDKIPLSLDGYVSAVDDEYFKQREMISD